jgi:hypothetical protein
VNVIIQINGREAIPVRALPWMTAWEFSAQEVAEALAHDKGYESFAGLDAYRFDDGEIKAVRVGEWLNSVTVSIDEFSEQELARADWERLSMAALPTGVFVWRDEWESAYNSSPYGPDTLAALGDADDEKDIDERTLNFAPQIPLYLVQLVMEGVTQLSVQSVMSVDTASKQETATPGAVVTVDALAVQAMTLDPVRRLALLRTLGGGAKYSHCEWKFTGISLLVKREKDDGRKRSSEKTIRDDLKEAAQAELDAKRAGAFDRLGQK